MEDFGASFVGANERRAERGFEQLRSERSCFVLRRLFRPRNSILSIIANLELPQGHFLHEFPIRSQCDMEMRSGSTWKRKSIDVNLRAAAETHRSGIYRAFSMFRISSAISRLRRERTECEALRRRAARKFRCRVK